MENKCPFCNLDKTTNKIVFNTKNFVFFYNNYPLTEGHLMIIPKLHIREEIDIPKNLWVEYLKLNIRAFKYIKRKFKKSPMIFINNPEDQSVYHFHKHFVPFQFGIHGVDKLLRSVTKSKL